MVSGKYKKTKEHKKKIGLANKGKIRSLETKTKLSKLYLGKTYEEIHGQEKAKQIKKKISNSVSGEKNPNFGNDILKGENNPSWVDGRSYIPYPYEFRKIRKSILKRDNNTCQLCNDFIPVQKKNIFISVHHIDYNKQNNSLNNLIALCTHCNSSVNTSREQWTTFFRKKLAQEVTHNG